MAKRTDDLFRSEAFLLKDWRERKKIASANLFYSQAESSTEGTFVALDEVGRGCVAGPIVVCATLWQQADAGHEFSEWVKVLRDSKKMTQKSREQCFATAASRGFLARHDQWENPPEIPSFGQQHRVPEPGWDLRLPEQVCKWTENLLKAELIKKPQKSLRVPAFSLVSAQIGFADASEIDAFGIIPALGIAASRAMSQFAGECTPEVIFFDGHRPTALEAPWADIPQILVTKGDDLLKSISASSVIAKVVRDRWMKNYSKLLPTYFFDEHCGYGTEKHRQALLSYGPSSLHRLSFLGNICPESVR
jgi:ribonuclease HII